SIEVHLIRSQDRPGSKLASRELSLAGWCSPRQADSFNPWHSAKHRGRGRRRVQPARHSLARQREKEASSEQQFEAFPPSRKDDPAMAIQGVDIEISARDLVTANDILDKIPGEELLFNEASVPREIWTVWLELLQGNHPDLEQFGAAREQLYWKVEADPT